MSRYPLDHFTQPITSGLTPCPARTGALSPARAAQLDEGLRRLDAARREAAAELARAGHIQ